MSPRMFYALLEARDNVERRMDLRFGVVAAVIANVNRDPEKRPAAFQAADFFPDVDRESQTEEEQLAALEMLAAVYGEEEAEAVAE